MSVNDRRPSYMGAPRPRVVSGRAGATDRASREYSPLQTDNMDQIPRSTASPKSGLHRELSTSEKRTERTTTTTREKVQMRTRNPGREATNGGNRSDPDKMRAKRPSPSDSTPVVRKKEKEQIDCEYDEKLPCGIQADNCDYTSAMESSSLSSCTLLRSSRQSSLCAPLILSSAGVLTTSASPRTLS